MEATQQPLEEQDAEDATPVEPLGHTLTTAPPSSTLAPQNNCTLDQEHLDSATMDPKKDDTELQQEDELISRSVPNPSQQQKSPFAVSVNADTTQQPLSSPFVVLQVLSRLAFCCAPNSKMTSTCSESTPLLKHVPSPTLQSAVLPLSKTPASLTFAKPPHKKPACPSAASNTLTSSTSAPRQRSSSAGTPPAGTRPDVANISLNQQPSATLSTTPKPEPISSPEPKSFPRPTRKTILLVGPAGCGKSTLANMLVQGRLLPGGQNAFPIAGLTPPASSSSRTIMDTEVAVTVDGGNVQRVNNSGNHHGWKAWPGHILSPLISLPISLPEPSKKSTLRDLPWCVIKAPGLGKLGLNNQDTTRAHLKIAKQAFHDHNSLQVSRDATGKEGDVVQILAYIIKKERFNSEEHVQMFKEFQNAFALDPMDGFLEQISGYISSPRAFLWSLTKPSSSSSAPSSPTMKPASIFSSPAPTAQSTTTPLHHHPHHRQYPEPRKVLIVTHCPDPSWITQYRDHFTKIFDPSEKMTILGVDFPPTPKKSGKISNKSIQGLKLLEDGLEKELDLFWNNFQEMNPLQPQKLQPPIESFGGGEFTPKVCMRTEESKEPKVNHTRARSQSLGDLSPGGVKNRNSKVKRARNWISQFWKPETNLKTSSPTSEGSSQ